MLGIRTQPRKRFPIRVSRRVVDIGPRDPRDIRTARTGCTARAAYLPSVVIVVVVVAAGFVIIILLTRDHLRIFYLRSIIISSWRAQWSWSAESPCLAVTSRRLTRVFADRSNSSELSMYNYYCHYSRSITPSENVKDDG